jgi:Mn2+/Fe2+ NRAMP family transporter
MSKKRILLISFCISSSYFGLSLIYFFGGLFNPITDNQFRAAIETWVTLPAIIIFSFGFGEGENAALIAGIIVFLIIWIISIPLTIIGLMMIKNRKIRTHNKS